MRVLITNLAWIELKALSAVDHHILTNDLTIVPKVTSSFNPDPKPVRLFAQTDTWLGVPVAYYLNKKDRMGWRNVEEVWKTSEGRPLGKIDCNIVLRPEDQQLAHDAMVAHLTRLQVGAGLLCAFTAFGKSVTTLKIIATLGRNAIFLFHRESLVDQWEKNVRRFWPGAKVGVIMAERMEFEGCDIVLASVQSLMYNGGAKYPKELWSYFGTLAVDETHAFGSAKFGSVAPRFSTRYKIGVSGTIRRADKCENVFKYVLGEIAYTASDKNRINPVIHVRPTPFQSKGNIDFLQQAALDTLISKSDVRNRFIARDIARALKAGRHPLVVSSRLDGLDRIKVMVNQECKALGIPFPTQGMFVGGKSTQERDAAAACDVVYATYGCIKEGVDIPRLDTLMMATPISDPEQTCMPAGELVWIGGDLVDISQVKEGQNIFVFGKTHTVAEIFRRKIKERLFCFKATSLVPLRLTGNHPIYVLRRYRSGGKHYKNDEPVFMPASKLRRDLSSQKSNTDFYVGLPILREEVEIPTMTPGLARLIGYYAAEGSISWITRINGRSDAERKENKRVRSGVGIRFAFHAKETEYHNDVIDIIEKEFGKKCWISKSAKNPNCYSVCCASHEVAVFLSEFVDGMNAVEKKYTEKTMLLPPIFQKEILEGHFRGDGSTYRRDYKHAGVHRYHTASVVFACQVQMLLLRQGIIASVQKYKCKSTGQRFSDKAMFEVNHSAGVRRKYQGIFVDPERDMVWFKVREAKTESFEGEVFNFSVNHAEAYVAAGGLVHNCGRICRSVEGKKESIVLDYVDYSIDKFKDKLNTRLRLYRSLNWTVQGIKI